ncbi:MAG: calcium-translocating P-type ATPase, PMCA-type [Actinomycetota bacterium]
MSAGEACERLGCDPARGLDEAEAARRLARTGPNRLPEKPPRPAWALFLDQFKSLLIVVLMAAGVLAGLIGDMGDMAVILVVVLFNAMLGTVQEKRAGRVVEALQGMLAQQARVRRGGEKCQLGADRLVPGDVVLLEAGDRVPADGRLVAAHGLEIDESTLTGESVAVGKTTDAVHAVMALADRANLAHMNTVVTRGRGEMVVTATGPATEIGRLAGLLEAAQEGDTPLQQRLDQLGRRLAGLAGVVVLVVLAHGLARGEPAASMVLTAVALAVAAIPEGLPAVVTVTLAIGMARMADRGAIVKRLAAVETLGSTTVICSDKTGTLTLNRMTAEEGWALGRRFGPADAPAGALLAARHCSEARLVDGRVIGEPTEAALLVLADQAGVPDHPWPRLAEMPFDSASRRMATLQRTDDGLLLLVKGAPEAVLPACTHVLGEDGVHPIDRAAIQAEVARMSGRALRVIALAGRSVDAPADPAAMLHGLVLHALVGLADPPRPGAAEAIAGCVRAGIAVKMITGDHKDTAAAIAARLGLDGEVLTGPNLDRLSDADLAACIDTIAVFARVAPEHKVRIVQALKARGHVCAMTGDGVNDAPALKAADIGVAMGMGGSDVAREAAAMVLTDDQFPTVVRAVAEGRTIYDNILKFVRFQLSTNIGALLAVLAAPLLGMAVPFHAIQILWVNIIMDGPPAMALAFDPPRPGLMARPPRPRDESMLGWRRAARLAVYGATMAAGTLFAFAHARAGGATVEEARTLAFTTFVLFQFFNLFNARVGRESAFGPGVLANGKLWLALAAVLGLQAVVVEWGPAQALFHTTGLPLDHWGLAALLASSVVVLDEARKAAVKAFSRKARTASS